MEQSEISGVTLIDSSKLPCRERSRNLVGTGNIRLVRRTHPVECMGAVNSAEQQIT